MIESDMVEILYRLGRISEEQYRAMLDDEDSADIEEAYDNQDW